MSLRIGIVGGGQLARMLSFEAKKMGFTVIVLDPTPNSPAGQVSDQQILGGYKDEKGTRKLASLVDIMTIDAEFVNDEVLADLEKNGIKIHPSPKTISIIKDKLKQKQFLTKSKIPVADFTQVESFEDIEKAGKKFGYPLLLKARTDAYDGKGNYKVKNKKDIPNGLEKLKKRPLYVEKYVPFVKELAVMVARSSNGEIKTFPVVETIHKDNICDTVIVPARVSKKSINNASLLAKKVMKAFKGAGVFGIEMFLLPNEKVLVNEIAPRVHNSGHYTIEGSTTSQFEQHIRAITGLPLGATGLKVPAVVMKNILGEKMGSGNPTGYEKALAIPHVTIHIYGKKESRPQRKMGHITVVGKNASEALTKANKARKLLQI